MLNAFYTPFAEEIARAEREVAHISLDKPEPEKLKGFPVRSLVVY